jgi:DNA-binding response OmpR family regulator
VARLLLNHSTGMSFRQQVIVATPDADESAALSAWLDAEAFEPLSKRTLSSARDAIASQPFDLAVVDAGFVLDGGLRAFGLARFRDTPMIVLGDAADSSACAPLGAQIMFLERPIDQATFICTVTMALMEARPDRRSPRRAIRPFEASVNGVKSYIIDVSREGVRLEIPRDRHMVTPQFALRVPLIGVGVSVQRVWVRVPRADEHVGVMWCGGQLGRNTVLADQAWQRFIDTVAPVGRTSSV